MGCPGRPRSRCNRRGWGHLARGRERTAGLPAPDADADVAARPHHAAPPPAAHLALADAEDAAAAAQAHARAPGLRGGAAEGEGAARGVQPPHRGEHQGGRPAPPARPQVQVAQRDEHGRRPPARLHRPAPGPAPPRPEASLGEGWSARALLEGGGG